MRYFYEKPKQYLSKYGKEYICNHEVYNICTLFLICNKGLAVIQQRILKDKSTWWGPIDPWLTDEIYLHEGFKEFFDKYASECTDGLYPTVTIRQIMWALKMKPMKKETWETSFDKKCF